MAIQNGVYEMNQQQAQAHLNVVQAVPAVANGRPLSTEGRKVFVSKKANQTFVLTPLRPGVLRVQVTGGCVC